MVKVAVVGCTHGELDALYETIDAINAEHPGDPIRLLLCCGDFESLRNSNDLKCKASPPRYRHMNSFHQYYRGEKVASVLTIFIGGNHEASNYLQELHYGGWVAPNIFYLGAAGVIRVAGLRIAGISGIYKKKYYNKGHYERMPYNSKALNSVYCVREFDIFQLSHLVGMQRFDAILSHDWPTNIEDHGDIDALLAVRPDFQVSMDLGTFGNPGTHHLLQELQPKKWLAGHMHVKFEAVVHHSGSTEEEDKITEFYGLNKCTHGKACFEVIEFPTLDTIDNEEPVRVFMDVEWLATLRACHCLASRGTDIIVLPKHKFVLDVDWVERRLAKYYSDPSHGHKQYGEWITDFVMTAPPLGEEDTESPVYALGNPQTDAILELLELCHVVTTPYIGEEQ